MQISENVFLRTVPLQGMPVTTQAAALEMLREQYPASANIGATAVTVGDGKSVAMIATTVNGVVDWYADGSGSGSPEGAASLGSNIFTGEQVVGVSSGDDSAFIAGRAATNPLENGGSHAFRDESSYASTATGGGYASFDSIAEMSGTLGQNHAHSFQSRLQITGAQIISDVSAMTVQQTVEAGATVANSYGVYYSDAAGVGQVDNQYALYCDNLTRGNTSNYCIYSPGADTVSYHAGQFQFGTSVYLSFLPGASIGDTTYGQLLSCDVYGSIIGNEYITIINGVLTLSNPTTAKVLATVVNLDLQATLDGVIGTLTVAPTKLTATKPVVFPTYTVGGLPSGASVGAGARAFVSDGLTPAFMTTVVGGGAVLTPVYSDGADWKVG